MKTMKLLVLLLTVSLLVSCGKNDDEGGGSNITVPNQNELTQTAYADQETTGGGFTFTAKSEWTATLNEVAVTKSADTSPLWWVKLLNNGTETYSGLAGTFKLAIELEPNYGGEARSAKIVIQSGNDKITVIVEQKGVTKEDKVPADPSPVTGISISSGGVNRNIEVGDKIQLTATITPQQATIKSVVWSSDKPEIATVNPKTGLVTAIALGRAIITARSTVYTSVVSNSEISVVEQKSGTSLISLDKTQLSLSVGKSETLIAKFTVSGVAIPLSLLTWSGGNNFVSVDNMGKVTALEAGQATITATYPNGTASCLVTVTDDELYTGSGNIIDNSQTISLPLNYATQKGARGRVTVELTNLDKSGVVELYFNTASLTDQVIASGTYRFSGSDLGVSAKTFTGISFINGHKTTITGGTITVNEPPDKVVVIEINATAVDVNNASCTIKGSYQGTLLDAVLETDQLTLNKTSLTLEIGQTESLEAILNSNYPDSRVAWSEGDLGVNSAGVGAVINVHSGFITPKNPGTATVTATSTYGGIASCVVTVPTPVATGSGSLLHTFGASNQLNVNYVIQEEGGKGIFVLRMSNFSNYYGDYIALSLHSNIGTETKLSSGTYTYGSDGNNNKFFMGTSDLNGKYSPIVGGTVKVVLGPLNYTIEIDVTAVYSDAILRTIKGTYTGGIKTF